MKWIHLKGIALMTDWYIQSEVAHRKAELD